MACVWNFDFVVAYCKSFKIVVSVYFFKLYFVNVRRIHMGRDFIRKDERKHDDKRITENISPSTTNSDREPRLWDAG